MYTLPAALFFWALGHIGSVNGVPPGASTRDTSTFQWQKMSTMTTCEPALVAWIYTPLSGQDVPDLTLSITNVGVTQGSSPVSSTVSVSFTMNSRRSSFSRRDTITETLTPTPITPSVEVFQWPSVNVTAGWYAMLAAIGNAVVPSLPFFVVNGSDISCTLPPISTTSSSPGFTASGGSGTPTASGGQPTSSGSTGTLPVSGSGSSKVNNGAIAGGVIGGLAVIAAAIAAYFYRRNASMATAPDAANNRSRRWDDLGSTDWKAKAFPTRRLRGASGRQWQTDSIGPMLSHDANVHVIGSVGTDSRPLQIKEGLNEYEGNSDFYPSQEKISRSPTRSNPFSESGHDDDSITPLPGSGVTRNSSTSTSSYINNNFSRPRSYPGSRYGSPTSTSGDGPFSNSAQNNTTSSLSHLDSSYPPSPALASGTSHEGGLGSRRGSAGEPIATGSHHTLRKPVPQYNLSDPVLTSPPPAPMSFLPQDSDGSREGSLHSGVGVGDLPKLTHRSSFGADTAGGRALHYLIPDMPPPQRD
ncbi:hypothetical protein C8F04DRAFT_1350071 [Mycena alexandri]|uniref:Uncharacterized protein n=1 Tax=Mycena alexandri TaxID=1745969 RepID=A0AAD6SUB1_9AGAR|nr:hypothetical protein C8F04DRAFT_1350071 [Mycena alexandri]